MKSKPVGSVDVLQGILNEKPYSIFCMKEPDYVFKLMSTYGGLLTHTEQLETRRIYKNENGQTTTVKFKYIEPIANHYAARHKVDDHNHLRHGDEGISIEQTWITSRWENRVFAFLMAIAEVNTFLIMHYFIWKNNNVNMTMLQFCKKLAESLIYNDHLTKEDEEMAEYGSTKHELKNVPPFARKFAKNKWEKTAKKKYQQYKCTTATCKKYIQTFCTCNYNRWICTSCYRDHLMGLEK